MQIKEYDHPDELLYHEEFCWIKPEGDTAVIGLHDFYCKLAGEISFIDMPDVGEKVSRNERIGTIETGKWIGKLVSPVTGEIIDRNKSIDKNPAIVNGAPYENWLLKIRLESSDEFSQLMDAQSAVPWLEQEIEKHT